MPKYLYVQEFAVLVRRHPRTIYRWIEEGYIKAIKVRGSWLIPYEEAERILQLTHDNV